MATVGRVEGARIRKPCLRQPAADLLKAVGVALVGVDQHVDGEEEAADRPGAIGIHEEFGDRDRPAGGERGEGLLQQRAAAGRPFAVQVWPSVATL